MQPHHMAHVCGTLIQQPADHMHASLLLLHLKLPPECHLPSSHWQWHLPLVKQALSRRIMACQYCTPGRAYLPQFLAQQPLAVALAGCSTVLP
jgi:hypothetical protein